MIRLSGLDILRFLANHYNFVRTVFNESKPEFIIDSDRFHTIISEYNTASEESKLSVSKLLDFKFCRPISTGDYKLNGHYTAFLEFIYDDFILDLPETLKTRYHSIFDYFTSLQSEKNEERIRTLIQEIIKVIEMFLNDIASQTNRLLKDTEALKVNANQFDLTIRIQKATYWVDEYIIPLNDIINKEHPNSIVNVLGQLQKYAGEKRILAESYEIRRDFERLYASSINAKSELDQTLGKLTRELIPLLDRIKSDSIILTGFYHLIENIDNPDRYIVPLPSLLRPSRTNAISRAFSSEAEFYIDQFSYAAPEVVYEQESEEIEWLPDASYFKEKLLKDNGSSDFYQWCFDILQTETQVVTLSKYFTVSNIILDEDLEVEYLGNSRRELQLSDAVLQMPKVKVYERISE